MEADGSRGNAQPRRTGMNDLKYFYNETLG